MKSEDKNCISYKYITLEDFIISLDRLTRFKHPSEKYYRVFKDILFKYLITPKFTKKMLETLPESVISYYVGLIWNESVLNISSVNIKRDSFYKIINQIDSISFRGFDAGTRTLMKTKLIIAPLLSLIESYDSLPKNLRLLMELNNKLSISESRVSDTEILSLRKNSNLKFPITKLILTEGITEEILLPKFAELLNYNFDKNGVYVLGSGGKSKMPGLYAKLKKQVKIPILILLDNDASEVYSIIKKSILKKDRIILINNGEFEDIVSKNLIKRAFNKDNYDVEPIRISDLNETKSMCENIKNIYKSRKIGEFQKAHFAKCLAQNASYLTDVTDEIKNIVSAISSI